MSSKEYRVNWGKMLTAVSPAHIKKGYRYLRHHGLRQFTIRLIERFQDQDIDYPTWFSLNRATEGDLEKQRNTEFEHPVTISIVVPLYQTPEQFLREMIESVQKQTYAHWELCLADASPIIVADAAGNSTGTALTAIVREYADSDPRIRYEILDENKGISDNTNRALVMATGEFVGLLDHDDLLEPDALFRVAEKILSDETIDMVYTDEDKMNRKGTKFSIPNMKPEFNPDMLRSNNYICHFLTVRKTLAEEVGGFDRAFDGAQDYDFVLRCSEKARKIGHVAKVLYHWRTHEKSTSDNPDSKMYAFEAGKRALEAHLKRQGIDAEVSHTTDLGYYRVKYTVKDEPLVSIIIPNRNQKETLQNCLESIRTKTTYKNYEIIVVENNSNTQEIFDYYKEIHGKNHVRVLYWKREFNFSAINNFAAAQAFGEYLILLNNDTEVITPDWIEEMLGNCQRPEVGMVGAKLYFPDDTVQSAGTIIGMGGMADHAFVGMPRRQAGYMHRASIQVDVSGVTAACAMVKRDVYEEVGGLEEELTVAFNDVDFGLKIVTAGYLIVFDPYAELYHYESKSRGEHDDENDRHKKEVAFAQEKWKAFLEAGDPCYSPNLTLAKHNFALRK